MSVINKFITNEKHLKFIETVMERVKAAEIGASAAAIAYYLLLSIFPLLIAVGNLLPFFNLPPDNVLPYIQTMLPDSIYDMLETTISSLLLDANGGLLSVSAIATLWAASRSINALQNTLNKVYGVAESTNKVFTRLFSFVAIFIFLIAMMLLALIFTLGQSVLDYLLPIFNLPDQISGLFGTLKWPVTMISLFFTMSVIYAFLPNAKLRFRFIFPGAVFTTIGWMLLTQGFGLYTKYISTGFNSYGIIGGFIIFMLWLDFAATLIITGGVINAVLEEYFNGGIEHRSRSLANRFSQLNQREQENKREKDT